MEEEIQKLLYSLEQESEWNPTKTHFMIPAAFAEAFLNRLQVLSKPKRGGQLSRDTLDLLIGILRGYSINSLSKECDLEPSVFEKALLGDELSEGDSDALEEIIREYSQE